MIVTIVWATPSVQDEVGVELPQGATVADAVARSGLVDDYAIDTTDIAFAIFGRSVAGSEPLSDGDRVELTRPLVADPKQARARRARRAALDSSHRRKSERSDR
jgi:putative ubiquitin-RnfH superfamily antitoxin RatB of RatAB toxin-antitoxin module